MNRYPDMGSAALYDALAARLGVPAERPRGWPPARSALIYQLVQAFCDPGDEVVFAWRSFEAYPIAVTAAAATTVQVPVLRRRPPRPRRDGGRDHRPHQGRAGLHAQQPDRPGRHPGRARRVPREGAVARAGRRRRGVRRVRADGRPVDGLATYRAHDNVVLTRTFSKAYGLAGFRVGYAVAPAPIAAALRAVSLPFGVSTRRPGRGVASLERRGRAARAGRGAGRRAGPRGRRAARGRLGRPRGAGQLRVVRARRPDRRLRGRRRRGSASSSARSPARAPGSRSASPRPTTG